MGGDFWRGLGSGLQQIPGRVENVAGLGLDALTTLNAAASHDPTALLRLQLLQSQAAQDPGVRSQLGSGGSPFFSGLLGYPVHRQQQAGPVQPGQGPLPTVLAPRLPPLSPATQADRALQSAETELIQANPQAAARAALHIPQPISEIAPPSTDLTLQRIGPSGPTYGVRPLPLPLTPTNIPGLLRDPSTNRVIREPTPRTEAAGRDYLTESREFHPNRLAAIEAGLITDPKISPAKAKELREAGNEHKAAQAAEREKRVQLVKQVLLTSPTRTMIETAPGVLKLADRVAQDMLRVQTGPFAGRWQELWAGRLGEADPDFIKLRGDITLLRRLLARMHIGARAGGHDVTQEFERVLGEASQSPENLTAGLQNIRDYAGDLIQRRQESLQELRGAGGLPPPTGAGPSAPETIPGVRFHGVVGP